MLQIPNAFPGLLVAALRAAGSKCMTAAAAAAVRAFVLQVAMMMDDARRRTASTVVIELLHVRVQSGQCNARLAKRVLCE
jgi:hypothetical protein